MTPQEARELAGRLEDWVCGTGEVVTSDIAKAAAALNELAGEVERCREALSKGHDADRVLFYEREFYVFSNFSAFRLEWSGWTFDTSEAAYHWEKFPQQLGIRHKIVMASSAHAAFKLAEQNRERRRPDWDKVKVGIMKRIIRAKADQHEYVRRKLLETGERELIEDSWRDDYWGWGPNRDGNNMLGRLWMEVRDDLRAEARAALEGSEDE